MWDERFAGNEFFYGTEPNDFLKEHVQQLSGKVLSIAEGEGRNAVFMARLGLEVLGVDGSKVGLEKAQKLAQQNNVKITTQVVDLADYTAAPESFDAVVSIFAHLPPMVRKHLHQEVEQALKPNGVILLEGYSKEQIHNNTGGPKNIDMLYSLAEIQADFPNCEVVLGQTIEREVLEGAGHTGLASVVQFIAKKKA